MNARPFIAATVSIALILGGANARAADPNAAPSPEELANRAYAEHEAGKYAEAIASYTQAYEISKAGAILFNIASIYDRKLHERTLAMEYYRRYLRAPDTEAKFVQKATARLEILKREAEDEAKAARERANAPSEPTAAPPAPPPQREQPVAILPPPSAHSNETPVRTTSTWRTTGIVVGGIGAAGIGVSLILGLVAKGKNDEANGLCGDASCSTQKGVELDRQAADFASAATFTFVAGAALLATGVTIYLISPKSRAHGATITFGPRPLSTGAGIGASATF
jgi:tetratricopeptide (TPR) repeat protein